MSKTLAKQSAFDDGFVDTLCALGVNPHVAQGILKQAEGGIWDSIQKSYTGNREAWNTGIGTALGGAAGYLADPFENKAHSTLAGMGLGGLAGYGLTSGETPPKPEGESVPAPSPVAETSAQTYASLGALDPKARAFTMAKSHGDVWETMQALGELPMKDRLSVIQAAGITDPAQVNKWLRQARGATESAATNAFRQQQRMAVGGGDVNKNPEYAKAVAEKYQAELRAQGEQVLQTAPGARRDPSTWDSAKLFTTDADVKEMSRRAPESLRRDPATGKTQFINRSEWDSRTPETPEPSGAAPSDPTRGGKIAPPPLWTPSNDTSGQLVPDWRDRPVRPSSPPSGPPQEPEPSQYPKQPNPGVLFSELGNALGRGWDTVGDVGGWARDKIRGWNGLQPYVAPKTPPR